MDQRDWCMEARDALEEFGLEMTDVREPCGSEIAHDCPYCWAEERAAEAGVVVSL